MHILILRCLKAELKRMLIMFCFFLGEGRVNENVALTMMHTLFVREHNRIEEVLHSLNPHWDGEKLYQVIAENED